VRVRLHEFPGALERDIARLGALWNDGLRRFGVPILREGVYAVDASMPGGFRIQSYG